MNNIFEIAARVSTPLALSGLFAAVVFYIFRQIIAKNIYSRLPAAHSSKVLLRIIDRLFLLAIVAMILGFLGYIAPKFQNSGAKRVQQFTTGPGSPALEGVKGDVNITVDQSSNSAKEQSPKQDSGKKK